MKFYDQFILQIGVETFTRTFYYLSTIFFFTLETILILQLEVIAIGIWSTTFTTVEKLGTQEVVRHPNLDLAKKVIINHKTKFDWTDCLSYVLGDFNSTNVNNQNEVINL